MPEAGAWLIIQASGHFRSPISEAPSADQPELDVQRPQRAQLEDQQLQNPGIHVPHLVSV